MTSCWVVNGQISSVLESEIDRVRGHERDLFETHTIRLGAESPARVGDQ